MEIVDIQSLGYYNVTKSIIFFDKRGNTKTPPIHSTQIAPHNYYKTCQSKKFGDPVSNVQSSKQAETDSYYG